MTARRTLLIVTVTAITGCGSNGSHQLRTTTSLGHIDGIYQRTTSAASVARHDHVPVAQATAENYGDFVLVIEHGHFAFTQHNAKACTWQYGTLRVRGNRMDWLFTDGGGRAPNNAENKPGEHFVWRARMFRGALTLVAIAPSDLSAETWRRTSATPSAKALTQRCRPPAAALPG